MLKNVVKRTLSLLLAMATVISLMPRIALPAFAADVTGLTVEGLTASSSGDATWTASSGNTITGDVAGTDKSTCSSASAKNGTLVLKNNRGAKALLTFELAIDKLSGSVTINDSAAEAGIISAELEDGDTLSIKITSGAGSSLNTKVTLSNISLALDTTATTTFKAPENGSYTVNGEAITVDTEKTQKSTEFYSLAATAADGYRLLGWYSTDAEGYISYNATASVNVEKATTIYPVFASETAAVFQVGNNLYLDLSEANTAAQADSSKQITLVQSGTLPAGTYEISSGVKLLIPFDQGKTANFDTETTLASAEVTPTMYSCLTLNEGTTINCYGSINVNAAQFTTSNLETGSVNGPYGAIQLNSGAQINMESGSSLYAYGYIGGEGMVHAKSGSVLCQLFTMTDWRGGTAASGLVNSMKGNSFIISQYYFQNIESPLRVDSGCTMYGAATITVSGAAQQTVATIIGQNEGMFKMSNGYAIIRYDAATDRSTLDFYGDLVTDSISLSMKVLISYTMKTSDYILALPMNYTINIKDGSSVTFSQKFKLMPGTEVNIEEGAVATINSSGALYLYDVDDWKSGNYSMTKQMYQLDYVYARKGAPVTRTLDTDAKLRVDGTLIANGPIYSTKKVEAGGNSDITGNGILTVNTHGSTSLKEITQSGSDTSTVTIDCVPALGNLAAHEGLNSFGKGTFTMQDDKWTQYTLTLEGEGATIVSGAEGAGTSTGTYANAYNVTPNVVISVPNGQDCFKLEGITRDKLVLKESPALTAEGEIAPLAEGGSTEYVITEFNNDIKITTGTHTESAEGEADPDSTCAAEGTMKFKCTVCDKILREEPIEKKEHTKDEGTTTPATCTTEGSIVYKCTVCQEVAETVVLAVDATNHTNKVKLEAKAPTCTETGLTEGEKCADCDTVTIAQEVVPALGHTEGEGIVESTPNCSTEGKKVYRCATCGEIAREEVLPKNEEHLPEVIPAVPATCTSTGLTEGSKCTRCGEILTAQQETEKLDHTYESVVTPPGCTAKGYTTYTCSECGDNYVADEVDALGHDYSAAVTAPTCTEQGYTTYTCARCDHSYADDYVEATGHSYGDWEITTAATCTADGQQKKTCACGDVVTEVIAAKGHSYGEWQTTTAATCEADGERQKTCPDCNDVVTETIDAIGHSYSSAVTTTATCMIPGVETFTCANCGDVYTEDLGLNENNHAHLDDGQYVKEEDKPTCEGTGVWTYTCECGSYTETEERPAAGHSVVIDQEVPNTCTATGLSEGSHCDVCGVTLKAQEVTPVLGHDYQVTKHVAANCEEPGYTQYTCSRCSSKKYEYEDPLGSSGHVYSTKDVTPTCTEQGYSKKVCSVCDHEERIEGSETDALGHDYTVPQQVIAPTCTEQGYTIFKCERCDATENGSFTAASGHSYTTSVTAPTCSVGGYTTYTCHCGETYKADETAPLGHTYGDWTETKAPTCTAEGEKTKTCSVCGDQVKEAVPATGHTYDSGKVTAPTCTEQGYTTYTCTAGDHSFVDEKSYVAALGHDYGEWVQNKAPTCTAEGEKTKTCTRCYDQVKEAVPATGHTYDAGKVIAPTCTEKGYTLYTCHCGDKKQENYVDALGHIFGEWVTTKEPTCIAEGEQKRTCTNTGCLVFETQVLEKTEHVYQPEITAPTCTEQGYTTYKCTQTGCTDSYVDEESYVVALGHDFSVLQQVNRNATCEEAGVKVMRCANAGCYETEEQAIPALGHDYQETVTKDPTCTEVGSKNIICANGCHKDSYGVEIPALGHTAVLLEGVAPTCTETGLTEGYRCSVCEEIYQPQEVVPALGHTDDDGTVIRESSCFEQGTMKVHCSVCGRDEEIALPLKEHTYVIDEAVDPECEKTGLTEGRHCSVEGCNYVEAQEEIPMLGHTPVKTDKLEPSCTTAGREEGTDCSVCGKHLTGDEIPTIAHLPDETAWKVTKPATCAETGQRTGKCLACGNAITEEIPVLEHVTEVIPAVAPRYDAVGYTEGSKCVNCLQTVLEPEEIPMLVLEWDTFLVSLKQLEDYAREYAAANPGKDATKLVINFIRTGVDRYNDDEWLTMAGAAETVFINEVLAKDEINGTHAYALREMDYQSITLPNGDRMEFDHMFGAMNVSSKNNYTQSNTDFGSWVGDLCDLMHYANRKGFVESEDMEAMIAEINEKYFRADNDIEGGFGTEDVQADLDAFYMIEQILAGETTLSNAFEAYYTASLSDRSRAAYFLNNRFPGKLTREEVREAVYTTYKDHILAQLLESGRDLSDKHALRQASCYTFADYLFDLAKDDLVAPEQPGEGGEEEPDYPEVYEVFSTSASTLAPGIVQTINYGIDSQGKQIVFFTAEADINREDVSVYANYNNNDPTSWAMSTVSSQMKAAEAKHTNPEDPENYIPNYTPIVGTNASFYNMSTGEPTGLFVMEGKTYKTGGSYFAILKDGSAVIAGPDEYNTYKDQIQEAVGGSTILVKNGEIKVSSADKGKAPRTVVGITAEGKVVLVVLDGRQEPYSAGASLYEMATILVDMGCVQGLNLDGGGSSTFDAKQEGSDQISLMNRPCDTFERSVSTSLMVVSTANVSKEFDHATLTTATDYLTEGSSFEVVATGVGAAGNRAEIPEGAYLSVSDASVGKIEDGRFVALTRGTAEIQLILDGNVVGSKTVTVIRRPDALKFTEKSLNAIYGIAEPLPLVATYQNANVTINANDIIWELSNAVSGTVENFAFTGNEASGVRNVIVTAKVRTDVTITANMSLRLYSANESIFDFNKVTAGNESLAWNRVVSNTITADSRNYYVEDPDKDVVTDYTFALDMKAIKAPVRLQPLMEYLNGFAGNMGENASPWDYLLALGARVSSLTNVVIRAEFPAGVEVDYSALNFVNDFMVLKNASFDEAKRLLTIELNWIRQTDGIDPSTANSIGILSGLKVIQKDETQNVQTVGITGNVTYDIYMDTSQLHSFAKDPQNQIQFGIKDYINPEDPEDAGGHFMDTYITFEDNFVVNRQKLNGWVTMGDDGMHYYYVDNEMVTGIRYVEDMEGSSRKYFYNFGEDGICIGKVTGLIELDGNLYYAINGDRKTGWWSFKNSAGEMDYYYFDPETGAAVDGAQTIETFSFVFENKILVEGQFVTDADGKMHYRWGNIWLMREWIEDNGKKYYAGYDEIGYGYFVRGLSRVEHYDGQYGYGYYLFGDDYVWQENYNGLYNNPQDGKIYLIEDGRRVDFAGLVKIGEHFYYFSEANTAVQNKEAWIVKTHGLLPEGRYTFDAEGHLILPEPEKLNGIVEEEDGLWYYVDGLRKYAGLIEIDGDYYYVRSNGQLVQNRSYWVTKTNGLLPEGSYAFGADGKMLNVPTVPDPTEPEPTEPEPTEPEPTEPEPTEPEPTEPEPTEPEPTEPEPTEPEPTEPEPTEPEPTEPKPTEPAVKNGIVAENGGLWYYVNGFLKYMGLIEIDGDYYYVKGNGQLVQNRRYWVTRTNDLVTEGGYTFDEYGRMVEAPGYDANRPPYGSEPTEPEVTEPEPTEPEPTEPEPTEPEPTEPEPTEPEPTEPEPTEPEPTEPEPTEPEPTEPKPTEPAVKNGIVAENGGLWYYVNGFLKYMGLIEIDGDYYYVKGNGQLVQNRRYWVTRTNDLVTEGAYTFDEYGRMVEAPGYDANRPPYGSEPTEPEVTEPKPTEPEVTEPQPTEPEPTEPEPTEPEPTEPEPTEPEPTEPEPTEPEPTEPEPTEPKPTEPKPTNPGVKNGIVAENGGLWYYVNGFLKYMGLIEVEGDYYYVKSNGQLVQNRRYWVTRTNDLVTEGGYTFDEYGRMVEAPGYDANRPPYGSEPTEPEVTEPKPTEPEVTEPQPTEPEPTEPEPTEPEPTEPEPTEPEPTEPEPTEPEPTEPKPTEPKPTNPGVKNGIVAENGGLWYYVNGFLKYMGLIEVEGDYYYVKSNGQLVQNRRYWVTRTNDLVTEGGYTFDEYGRMVEAPGYDANRPPYGSEPTEPEVTEPKPTEPEVTEPQPTEPEPTEPEPTEPEPTEPEPTEPEPTEPKPTEPKPTNPGVKNGIVAENGGLWYYVNGFLKYMGLIEIDGDYYYVKSNGQLVQSRRYWITKTNGLLPEAGYEFAADGKLVR